MASGMNVERRRAGEILVLSIGGFIDDSTIAQFDRTLTEAFRDGVVKIVLDLRALNYANSSGIALIMDARRRARAAGGDVVLCRIPGGVQKTLETLGFLEILRVAPDVEGALAAFAAGGGGGKAP